MVDRPPVLAGVTAWVLVSVIRGHAQGHEILPIDSGGGLSAVIPALVLGMLAVFVGVVLRLIIRATNGWTERFDRLWLGSRPPSSSARCSASCT
jgi:hypothetical protein